MDMKPTHADPLAEYLGITIVKIEPGYAEAVLEVKPELLNGYHLTHGAVIFALADVVFGAASNSHGPPALALNVNISFIKATRLGESLRAVCREENLTKRTGLYRMEVTDSGNEPVAIAEGLAIRKVKE